MNFPLSDWLAILSRYIMRQASYSAKILGRLGWAELFAASCQNVSVKSKRWQANCQALTMANNQFPAIKRRLKPQQAQTCYTAVLNGWNTPIINSLWSYFTNFSEIMSTDTHNFRFWSLHTLHIEYLSNCCRHKYDQSISRFFEFYFWRDFSIWPNCVAWARRKRFGGPNWPARLAFGLSWVKAGWARLAHLFR